jgi:HEAT repeat protein
MKKLPAIFLILLFMSLGSAAAQRSRRPASTPSPVASAGEKAEWETLKKRFGQYGADYLMSRMWALIHTYRSKSQLDETMNLLQVLFAAMEKNDQTKLRPVGGLTGFQNRFVRLMNSDDDTVAGFSARVLAVCFGMRYGPQIAALMNKRDKSFTDEDVYPEITSRGNAAVALSILETTQYTQAIAALLKSVNIYDRSGAAYALAHLKATEYASEIAGLLVKQQSGFRRDESPIHALIEMGVGPQYKKEIAQALDEDFSSEANEAAVYALAHLRAMEYAPAIARLLDHRYRRGNAAKALAIMGAREYAAKIATLLDDDEASLDQSAALLALGILKANEYAPRAVTLMRTKSSSFVSNFAALSLTLMGKEEYAKEVIAVLSVNKTGKYVDEGELHPLVAEDARQINQRVLATLEQFKSRRLPSP